METKTCSTCKVKVAIPTDQFNWKNKTKNIRYSYCKLCWSEISKSRYSKNKQYYIDKAHRRTEELRLWIKELKIGLSCSKCGESHWSCLDHHHKDDALKEFNLSDAAVNGYSKKRILAEMEKCVVLCSNCHRKVHFP